MEEIDIGDGRKRGEGVGVEGRLVWGGKGAVVGGWGWWKRGLSAYS